MEHKNDTTGKSKHPTTPQANGSARNAAKPGAERSGLQHGYKPARPTDHEDSNGDTNKKRY